MSGIETIFLGFVLAAFAAFGLLLLSLEQGDRRKLGYRSGPEPRQVGAAPANDTAEVRKAA